VDFAAARAASRRQLGECAIAAAGNAQDLVADAELLAGAGRSARAYSVAALAVEECGKALTLCALSNMTEALKAQAPVGGMLEWHGLKLVGGMLLALVPFDSLAPRVADMSSDELAEVLAALDEPADEADRLKRRGMYVDIDGQGRIRRPSEITGADVEGQLGRARQAAASVSVLLAPDARERLASPLPPDGVELLGDLVAALRAAGTARTPPAAAGVITRAVSRYRERKSGRPRPDWGQRPGQRFLPR